MKKKYGCLSMLFDLVMIGLTGGLWLIWLFVKHVRTH